EPPRSAQAPSRLWRALERALRRDPGDRWPSMDALLAALARDPAAKRRRWLVAAGAVALVAAARVTTLGELRARRHPPCKGAERHLATIWDEPARGQVRAAFQGTGRGYADDAFRGVSHELDGYAAQWTAMHTEACEATRLRGEQSERVLDLRMACLEHRRGGLRALVEVLARADGKTVGRAVQAAQSLAPISDCADLALLDRAEPPPGDPTLRRRVDAIDAELTRARALEAAGQFQPALAIAASASAEASAVGYPPILAAALYLVGVLENDGGDGKEAEKLLRQALLAAEAGRRSELAADAPVLLVPLLRFHPAPR